MNLKVNRHVIINLIVVAGVVMLAVWIMNNTYWAETTIPKPLSGEAATNPFYAAQKLAAELGARSEWKHILGDSLDKHAVLVMSNWNWDVIEQRRDTIQKWVEAGGRLILDASLITADDSFSDWSGLKYNLVKHQPGNADSNEDSDDDDQDTALDISEHGHCNTLDVIESMVAVTGDASTKRMSFCNYGMERTIASQKKVEWGLKDNHGWQAARVNIGKGSVTLFNALPYQYRGILLGDHALLFAAATQLKRDEQIFFIMDEKGVPLLKLVWRYGSPAVILALVLVVAALWRNAMRFGPMAAVPETARRSLSEQIAGTGKFILQFNGDRVLHAATAGALTDAARICIIHYERLDAAAKIDALAKATGISAEELQTAIHYQGSRRASELKHAIAIMESARRRLIDQKANKVSDQYSEKSSGRAHAS